MKEYLNQEDRKRSAHPRPVKLAKQPESHREKKNTPRGGIRQITTAGSFAEY